MNDKNLNITVPLEYQDRDVIFKINQKKDNVKMETFQSFSLYVIGSTFAIKDKRIHIDDLYTCLKKHGLSNTIPVQITLGHIKMTDFDWTPHCYGGPTVWPFQWNNITCSLTGKGNHIYIRIHDMTPGIADTILNELTDELLTYWTNPTPTKTLIVYTTQKTIQGYQWIQMCNRAHRDMDTIYINKDIKNKMIARLNQFYSSSEMYDRYGVSWKRVHLFYGLAGSGKSSTVLALASHFGKNISKMTLTPDLNSQDIERLFQTCKDDSFLLLEDVDALFTERQSHTAIDFSTLLNCMDGIATKRGLVLFMTTNYINKLDDAFLRPGRVDFCVEFNRPGLTEIREALKVLGAKYSHEHEDYINFYVKDKSIAAIQKHLFECMMDQKDSILFD